MSASMQEERKSSLPLDNVVPQGTVADRVALFTPKKAAKYSDLTAQRPYSRTPSRLKLLAAEREARPNAGSRVSFGKRREGSFGSPATRGLRYADDPLDTTSIVALRPDLIQKTHHGHIIRPTGHVGGQSSAPFEEVLEIEEPKSLLTSTSAPYVELPDSSGHHQSSHDHVEAQNRAHIKLGEIQTQKSVTKNETSQASSAQSRSYQRMLASNSMPPTQDGPARQSVTQHRDIYSSYERAEESAREDRFESHSYRNPTPRRTTENRSQQFEPSPQESQETEFKEQSRDHSRLFRSLQDIREDVQTVIDSSSSGRSVRKQLEREAQEKFLIQKGNLMGPVESRENSHSDISSADIHTIYCSGSDFSEDASTFGSSSSSGRAMSSMPKPSQQHVNPPDLHHTQPIAVHKKPKFLESYKSPARDTERAHPKAKLISFAHLQPPTDSAKHEKPQKRRSLDKRVTKSMPVLKQIEVKKKASRLSPTRNKNSQAPHEIDGSRKRRQDLGKETGIKRNGSELSFGTGKSTPFSHMKQGRASKRHKKSDSADDDANQEEASKVQAGIASELEHFKLRKGHMRVSSSHVREERQDFDSGPSREEPDQFSRPESDETKSGPQPDVNSSQELATSSKATRKTSIGSFLNSVNAPIRQWSFGQILSQWKSHKKEDETIRHETASKQSIGDLSPERLLDSPPARSTTSSRQNTLRRHAMQIVPKVPAHNPKSTLRRLKRAATSIPVRQLGTSEVPQRSHSLRVSRTSYADLSQSYELAGRTETRTISGRGFGTSHGIIGVKVIVMFEGGREVEVQTSISEQS